MNADDRNSPSRRRGALGVWDEIVGPGADGLETALIVGAMVAGPGLAIAWALAAGVDWAWWQWLVLAILACDLVGGLACNGLEPAKRWHHRPGRPPNAHFLFCALHVHPLILALAMPDAMPWRTALIVYGLLLAGAGLVIGVPARLKTAVSLLVSAVAILACSLRLAPLSALGWVPVVLFLKVLAGFLVPPPPPERVVEPDHPIGPWS
jgi:hypothetical protein